MGTLCGEAASPLLSAEDVISCDSMRLRFGTEDFVKGMTDRKGSNHGLLGLRLFFSSLSLLFIRMYCSMPFIPDDRKLLCCQDAAAGIEGKALHFHFPTLKAIQMNKRDREHCVCVNVCVCAWALCVCVCLCIYVCSVHLCMCMGPVHVCVSVCIYVCSVSVYV